MKNNFHERRQNRISYAREKAAKKNRQSDQLYANSKEMADSIPLGQPILVGHHSEGKDRRFRKKIAGAMEKPIKAQQAATYYSEKADTIEGNKAIFSDDPNALTKLHAKLKGLQDSQAFMKAANKCIKRGDKVAFLHLPGSTERMWTEVNTPDCMRRIGFPAYVLQNNNAEITRVKKRISDMERRSIKETTEQTINGVQLVENVEANRVQLIFPGKPTEDIRKLLKRSGFHWSSAEGVWQRHLNDNAIWPAKALLQGIK